MDIILSIIFILGLIISYLTAFALCKVSSIEEKNKEEMYKDD